MRGRGAVAGAAALAVLVLLAGCQKSFDERYAEAQKKIGDTAAAIDKDLAAKASEAAVIEGLASEPAPSTAAPNGAAAGPNAGQSGRAPS